MRRRLPGGARSRRWQVRGELWVDTGVGVDFVPVDQMVYADDRFDALREARRQATGGRGEWDPDTTCDLLPGEK